MLDCLHGTFQTVQVSTFNASHLSSFFFVTMNSEWKYYFIFWGENYLHLQEKSLLEEKLLSGALLKGHPANLKIELSHVIQI